MGSPLWYLIPARSRQRGVRGDFVKILDLIGVLFKDKLLVTWIT